MQSTLINDDMQRCIDECLHCYRTCLQTAVTHCLDMGGAHVAPAHFRLMLNCSQLCRTTAEFMMSASPLHAQTCALCADTCVACADSCEQVGDMDECVQACRDCAQSCRQMAASGGAMTLPQDMSAMPTGMQDRLPM